MKGLINVGNTCYFNSALQCILQVPPMSNLLIFKVYNGECDFTREYQNLVKFYWFDKTNLLYNPTKLLSIFKQKYKQFDNNHQHDSQECFFYILEILEKSLGEVVKQIFYGETIQETVCRSEKTSRREPFTVSMLTIQQNDIDLENMIHKTQKWTGVSDYEDNAGKVWSIAATRSVFWKAPRILIFSFPLRQKVILKDELNLKNFLHPESINNFEPNYELFAMCHHNGNSHGGHYTAYTKHKGQWYLKDDDVVKAIDDCPLTAHHYLVFYKLK